jgi:hypothetical protein
MSDSDPLDTENVSYLVEASFKVSRDLVRETLNVIDMRKEDAKILKEIVFALGKILVHHYLHQVREVVAAVETDPVDALIQDEA